jgi:putative ABC transport system ATP-binding protein
MSAPQRLLYRRSVVGFIWQQTSRNLLPYLTGLQNVQLPLRLAGASRSARLGMRERVRLEAEPDHIGVWPDKSGEESQ